MATVDKDFRVKHGLVVEGTTATVNGEDILTTGSTISTSDLTEGTNLFFTDQRAVDAVTDEINTAVEDAIDAITTTVIEEGTNLYFTNQRALDATSAAYDPAGAAATAQSAAEDYADGLAGNYDSAGSASTVQTNLDNHALDTSTHGVTGAIVGTTDTQTLTNKTIDTASNSITVVAADVSDFNTAALSATASAYDAAGAAATAESNANDYTDTELGAYTPTSSLDTTVGGYGYIKTGDLSGLATESYVNTAVDNLVDGAPGLLDTLNEIAAAIADDENYATTMTTALAGKQNELTAGTNISIVSDTISVTGLASTDISDFNTAALSATASAYDAAGAAATAEGNANDYTDTALEDYTPTSGLDAAVDGYGYLKAEDIDVSGDIQTAIDALTTTDIEEGTNLYFTDTRAVDAIEAVVPNFTAVDVNSLAKQVAATATSLGSVVVTAYSFNKSEYKTAKFIVKIDNGTDNEVTEVLLTLDSGDNIAITEYAIVGTNGSRGTITADISGSSVRLRVNPVNDSTINVVGTLLA